MHNTKSWLWGIVGALLAIVVTLGVVNVLRSDDEDTTPAAGNTPTSSPSPTEGTPGGDETSTPSPTQPMSTFTVAAYYLGDTPGGSRLYREFHQAHGPDAATAAVRAAINGGLDPDYNSPWAPVETATARGDKDLVTVDLLAPDPAQLQRPVEMEEYTAWLALEQLMRTAQGALKAGRAPVQFLVNGKHINQIFGVPASEPLANAKDEDVLAHVWVNTPAHGATVHAGDTVEGLAASFEANVTWELRQGSTVVKKGSTTAEECCRMAPYSFELPDVPAGVYTLVVSEDDPSGGEGPGPDQDTKVITFA